MKLGSGICKPTRAKGVFIYDQAPDDPSRNSEGLLSQYFHTLRMPITPLILHRIRDHWAEDPDIVMLWYSVSSVSFEQGS